MNEVVTWRRLFYSHDSRSVNVELKATDESLNRSRFRRASLETERFAALRGSHRAPDAVRTLAGGNLVGVKIASVDRIGNETNGAVHHSDVDAAGVIALSAADDPRIAI